jgi:high-affinity iron transporter
LNDQSGSFLRTLLHLFPKLIVFLIYQHVYFSPKKKQKTKQNSNALFNVAIATIFAREMLEGAVIIAQYRTVIRKSESMNDARKTEALKIVTHSAALACILAILVVLAAAIPLAVLGSELDANVVKIVEAVSKLVASICILQLSVKIPVLIGYYKKVSILPWKKYDPEKTNVDNITNKELYFNVAWNIWREVAECGVFLIPFFLSANNLKAIPISAVVGALISLVLVVGIFIANHRTKAKFWLSFTMGGLTLFLAAGLFMGGCHLFEKVYGTTMQVWEIKNPFWNQYHLPMTLFKPFGYSSTRTVLQICTFWGFLALGLGLHYIKYRKTQQVLRDYPEVPDETIPFDNNNRNINKEAFEASMKATGGQVAELENGETVSISEHETSHERSEENYTNDYNNKKKNERSERRSCAITDEKDGERSRSRRCTMINNDDDDQDDDDDECRYTEA